MNLAGFEHATYCLRVRHLADWANDGNDDDDSDNYGTGSTNHNT